MSSWLWGKISGNREEKSKREVPIHPESEPTKLVITELEKIIYLYNKQIQPLQEQTSIAQSMYDRKKINFEKIELKTHEENHKAHLLQLKFDNVNKRIEICMQPIPTLSEYITITSDKSEEAEKEKVLKEMEDKKKQLKTIEYDNIPEELIPKDEDNYHHKEITRLQRQYKKLREEKDKQNAIAAKTTKTKNAQIDDIKQLEKNIQELNSKINNIRERWLNKIQFLYYMTKYHLLMLEEKMPKYQINEEVEEMSATDFVHKNESLANYPPNEMLNLIWKLREEPTQLKLYMDSHVNKESSVIEKLMFNEGLNEVELPETKDIAKKKIKIIISDIQEDLKENGSVELEDIVTILRTFFNLCFIYGVQDQDDDDFVKVKGVSTNESDNDDFEEEEEEEISQVWFNQEFIEFTFKSIGKIKNLKLNTPMLREGLLKQILPKQFDDDMRLMKDKEYCPFNQYMYEILQNCYTREWTINRWLLFTPNHILNIANIFKNNQTLLAKLRMGIDNSLHDKTPIEHYDREKIYTLQYCYVQPDNSGLNLDVYTPSSGLYIPLKQKLRTLMYDLTSKTQDIDIEQMIKNKYDQFVLNLTEVDESDLVKTGKQLRTNLEIYCDFLDWDTHCHKGSYYKKATENTNENSLLKFADEFHELYQHAKMEIFKTMPLIMTDQNESLITNYITNENYEELEKLVINYYFAKTSNEEEEEEVEGGGEDAIASKERIFQLASAEDQHEMHSMEDIKELIKKGEAHSQVYDDYQAITKSYSLTSQLQNYGPKTLIKKKIKEQVNVLFKLIEEYNGRVSLGADDNLNYHTEDSSSKEVSKEIDLQKAIGMNAWMPMLHREFKREKKEKEEREDGYDEYGMRLEGLGNTEDEKTPSESSENDGEV